MLLAVGIGWLLDHRPLNHFRLLGPGALWGLVATVPMLSAFALMVRWPIGPLRGIKTFTDTVVRPLMATCTIVDLLGISMLAGVGEEMLFRGLVQDFFAGWMQDSFAGRLPPWLIVWLAVLLASLLFGLMHAVTPTYAGLAALTGVYLGTVYLWTGNLLAPIIAHGLYDFVVLLYLVYGPEPPEPVGEKADDSAASGSSEDSSTPVPPSSL
jgi:membrane protease YdiL (CAAX protease family)